MRLGQFCAPGAEDNTSQGAVRAAPPHLLGTARAKHPGIGGLGPQELRRPPRAPVRGRTACSRGRRRDLESLPLPPQSVTRKHCLRRVSRGVSAQQEGGGSAVKAEQSLRREAESPRVLAGDGAPRGLEVARPGEPSPSSSCGVRPRTDCSEHAGAAGQAGLPG